MSVAGTSLTSKLKVIPSAWIILLFLDGESEQSCSSFSILYDQRYLQSFQGIWKAPVFCWTIISEHSFASQTNLPAVRLVRTCCCVQLGFELLGFFGSWFLFEQNTCCLQCFGVWYSFLHLKLACSAKLVPWKLSVISIKEDETQKSESELLHGS